jgi:hypothetical protein
MRLLLRPALIVALLSTPSIVGTAFYFDGILLSAPLPSPTPSLPPVEMASRPVR